MPRTWLSATVIVTGSLSVRTPLGSLSLVLLEIGLGLGFASDLSKCCLSPCRSRPAALGLRRKAF